MKIRLFLVGGLLVWAVPALANPVMVVQEFRGQAVAGPHVKLTYTYSAYSPPIGATTHGTSHTDWVQVGFATRDTGSGARSLPILQRCDCHVPTGTTLDYALVFATGTSPTTLPVVVPSTPSGTGDCVAECQEADVPDAATPDAPLSIDVSPDLTNPHPDTATPDSSPPDLPLAIDGAPLDAPVATGGVTSVDARPSTGGATSVDAQWGTGGTVAPAPDAALASGGVPATGGTPAPTKSSGGGCAIPPPGRTSPRSLLGLLGLAFLAMGIRRRP